MKIKLSLLLIAHLILSISCSGQKEKSDQRALDLKKCNIHVEAPYIVNNIQTVEGDKLQSEYGKTKLIEIKINHRSNNQGYFFIHKDIPKLMCVSNDENRIYNSIAVAIKYKDPLTGEVIEKYHNEATMLTEVILGENIDYYAVFEVPQQSMEYRLMLQTLVTDLKYTNVDHYTTDKIEAGELIIKRSRRNAHLMVVHFKMTSNILEKIVLCNESFAASYLYRSHPKMMVSKAVGIMEGSEEIIWIDPGNQKTFLPKNGKELHLKVVFEVPKETDEFEFHELQTYGSILVI